MSYDVSSPSTDSIVVTGVTRVSRLHSIWRCVGNYYILCVIEGPFGYFVYDISILTNSDNFCSSLSRDLPYRRLFGTFKPFLNVSVFTQAPRSYLTDVS